ncbi:hypothetical protein OSTOST_04894 [Ostertagia ostertagi]
MSLVSYTTVPDNHQEPCDASTINPERCDDTDLIAEDSIHGATIPIAFREILFDLHLRQSQRIFCPAHAWCRFPLEVFDAEGCGAMNRYGFDSGEPCFLFELKLQSSWTPIFTRNVTLLPFKCDAYDQASLRKNPEVKIISAFGNGTQDGFPVNKVRVRVSKKIRVRS